MNLKQIIEFLKKVKQPQSDPKQIKIIIDPGHGGKDLGLNTVVKGKRTPNRGYKGVMEKDINLEVSTRVAWLCARHGMGHLLTRYGDRFISLKERCQRANRTKAKLFLSIHCNYSPSFSSIKGVETWYYKKSRTGFLYASRCQKLLMEDPYSRNRGIKSTEVFYVLKKTNMSAVLVELGYLSNPRDALYLDKEENQMKIATQLWQFIKEVC